MAIVGAIVAGVGMAMGGIGQERANQQNWRIAREQMRFQERMSNTAVQRRMADLEKAGINPILAARMEASSPQGASAQMGNVGKAAAEGAATGMQLRQMAAVNKNINADTLLKKSEANESTARTFLLDQQAYNESLKSAGIISANEIAKAESQLKQLDIPGAVTLADFYEWMNKQDPDKVYKAMEDAGPLISALARAFMLYKAGR
jgi:hypothetical protein